MVRNPMFVLFPTLPESRPPPRIGICSPFSPTPIRRLKKISIAPACPTEKAPAFSRKNGRFSRKEQPEAIQVDLFLVDLDLGKVGVVGHVQGQAPG